MDLALELGMPVGVMSRAMTERELRRWYAYRNKKPFPSRRLEIYLAQVAQVVVAALTSRESGEPIPIEDFFLEFGPAKAEKPMTIDEAIAEARAAFGYNPQNKT